MKQICCLAEHMDWAFTASTHYPDFNELAQILHHATGMDAEALGASDITLRGEDISRLIAQLEIVLKEKLAVFQEGRYPSFKLILFGRKYQLDPWVREHSIIHLLANLLDTSVAELEKRGVIWFYNLSALDNTDHYILKTFKAASGGIELDAAFEAFKKKREDFAGLPGEEFSLRVEKLKENNFIIDRQTDDGRICWSPTVKTLRLKII